MVLRDMRWQDIPTLVELERELFPTEPWSEATWWGELAERPRRHYAVTTDGKGITGYVGVDRAGGTADIMTLAVASRAQGHGLGRTLLDNGIGASRSSGATALMLEVRDDNTAARALYDRAGFAEISRRRRYYQPGDVDALVLRLLIDGGGDGE